MEADNLEQEKNILTQDLKQKTNELNAKTKDLEEEKLAFNKKLTELTEKLKSFQNENNLASYTIKELKEKIISLQKENEWKEKKIQQNEQKIEELESYLPLPVPNSPAFHSGGINNPTPFNSLHFQKKLNLRNAEMLKQNEYNIPPPFMGGRPYQKK